MNNWLKIGYVLLAVCIAGPGLEWLLLVRGDSPVIESSAATPFYILCGFLGAAILYAGLLLWQLWKEEQARARREEGS